jgi:peroxiredoxin Q/BCP
VLGVSLDSVESHAAFADHHDLPFLLLADPGGALAAKYGVDTSGGHARRVTFVIGPDGTIRKVFPKVQVQGHSEEVLAVLRGYLPGSSQ